LSCVNPSSIHRCIHPRSVSRPSHPTATTTPSQKPSVIRLERPLPKKHPAWRVSHRVHCTTERSEHPLKQPSCQVNPHPLSCTITPGVARSAHGASFSGRKPQPLYAIGAHTPARKIPCPTSQLAVPVDAWPQWKPTGTEAETETQSKIKDGELQDGWVDRPYQ